MSESEKGCDYSLRLPIKEAKAVNKVCRKSSVSFDQVVSLCIRKALPSVGEALSGETGRVTNVDPLPATVARRLYRQADDDTAAIRLFMAAQAKAIEE